jgi:hypothetical protein
MSTSTVWVPFLILTLDAAGVPLQDATAGTISYGKAGDALSYSGGTMVLTLQNYDGKYTPGDSGALHGAEPWLGKAAALFIYDPVLGAFPTLFTGVCTNVDFDLASVVDSTITVTFSDVLGEAATEQLVAVTIAGTTAEAQINEVLAASDVAQTTVINPSGQVGATLTTAHSPITSTVGAALGLIEMSDGGDVYCRAGRLVVGGTAGNVHFRTLGQTAATGGEVGAATFATSGEVWTKTAHGFLNGDPMRFSAVGTGPTSTFIANTTYWVVGKTANTFQLAATEGGAALADGSNSAGTWTAKHYRFLSIGDGPSGRPFTFKSVALSTGGGTNYTTASFTRLGGSTPQVATAAKTYGSTSITRTGLLTSTDGVTLTLAEQFLEQYGPGVGVPSLQVHNIEGPPVRWGTNVEHELAWYSVGDRCEVSFTGPGPTAVEQKIIGIISKVSWRLTATAFYPSWALEDNRIDFTSFTLDDADLGILDESRLG